MDHTMKTLSGIYLILSTTTAALITQTPTTLCIEITRTNLNRETISTVFLVTPQLPLLPARKEKEKEMAEGGTVSLGRLLWRLLGQCTRMPQWVLLVKVVVVTLVLMPCPLMETDMKHQQVGTV